MFKKLSLPVIMALLVVSQSTFMIAAQYNYGYTYSWNVDINGSLYNYGSISGSNVSIMGHTENLKKGVISGSSYLKINNFTASIDGTKHKDAIATIKYPNGYLNIFCKNKSIDTYSTFETEKIQDITLYKMASNLKIEVSKESHVQIIDGVIYVLSRQLDEPEKEEKSVDASWYTAIINKILHYPRALIQNIISEKQELIMIENNKYKVLKPNKIIINNFANDIDLVNEGTILIGKIKLEIF